MTLCITSEIRTDKVEFARTFHRPTQPEPKSGNAPACLGEAQRSRERVPTAIGNRRRMPLRFETAANGSLKDRLHSIAHSPRATARPDRYWVGTRSRGSVTFAKNPIACSRKLAA
jgi:hypothetical protein